MTITNVVGPLMVTMDRFVIGAFVSMSAVAYYATPYEAITKLWLIPNALIGVMFPAFSASFGQNDKRTALLFNRSVKALLLTLFPVTLCAVVFARDGLTLWLGPDFAQYSYRVLQWLAVGVFLNSLALVPFTLLQSVGRPDLTAKIHLIELPLYSGLLWWLINKRGVEGAAIAWTGRIVLDGFALFFLVGRVLPHFVSNFGRALILIVSTICFLAVAAVPNGLISKALFLISVFISFCIVGWFTVLTLEERVWVWKYLRQVQVWN